MPGDDSYHVERSEEEEEAKKNVQTLSAATGPVHITPPSSSDTTSTTTITTGQPHQQKGRQLAQQIDGKSELQPDIQHAVVVATSAPGETRAPAHAHGQGVRDTGSLQVRHDVAGSEFALLRNASLCDPTGS